jgi:hypothetical protein
MFQPFPDESTLSTSFEEANMSLQGKAVFKTLAEFHQIAVNYPDNIRRLVLRQMKSYQKASMFGATRQIVQRHRATPLSSLPQLLHKTCLIGCNPDFYLVKSLLGSVPVVEFRLSDGFLSGFSEPTFCRVVPDALDTFDPSLLNSPLGQEVLYFVEAL